MYRQIGSLSMKLGLYRYDLPLIKALPNCDDAMVRSGLIIRRYDGWGEICPLPYHSLETIEEAQSEALRYLQALNNNEKFEPTLPSVQFGVDCMNEHLSYDISFYSRFSKTYRILLGTPKQIMYEWFQLLGDYPNVAKLIVGNYSLRDELRLIKEICKKAPDIKLILDASMKWTREEACTIINHLPKENILYIEDMCNNLEDVKVIAENTGIPVGIDKLLHYYTFDQWRKLPNLTVVIKPSLVGGFSKIHELVKLCSPLNIKTVLETAMESQLGNYNLQILGQRNRCYTVYGVDCERYFKYNIFKPGTAEVDRKLLTVIWESDD
jgi:O-succinylbenzoate synthase